MKIRIFDSREECLTAGAWAFIKYALAHPDGTIGCCTGTTTEPIHEMISEIYRKNPFDASGLHTVNADEFLTPKGYDKGLLTMRPPDAEGTVGCAGHRGRPGQYAQSRPR